MHQNTTTLTTTASPKVPKILHQIWIQGRDAMPSHYRQFSQDWQAQHPDWTYMFWDEQSLTRLVTEHAPQYLMRFLSYDRPVLKADFGRVMALDVFGGIYLDMDTQPVGRFTAHLHYPDARAVYLCTALWPLHLKSIRHSVPRLPSNYCMVGPARHPFWRYYLAHMAADSSPGGSVQITGPIALAAMAKDGVFTTHQVELLPPDTFLLPSQSPDPAHTVGYHNYESTWIPKVLRPLTQQVRYIPFDLVAVAGAGMGLCWALFSGAATVAGSGRI